MRVAWSVALVLLLAASGRGEEEAEKVFRTCNPGVVGLENLETSGSGIIVSTGGLILTNAHVLASPLRYRVLVDVPIPGGTKTVVFNKPKVVGFHPTYDLALLRIDPSEQNVRLTPAKIARTKAGPGKRVYAIGNPVISGMTLTKSITDGMLSAADREMDGLKYYQFSAPINPGNSGGPLLDKDGNVLGLVTFKMTDADGVGFAIPLHDFDPAMFEPARKGGGNVELANVLTREGAKFHELGRKLTERLGKDHKDVAACRFLAFLYLRQALAEIPDNGIAWANVGLAWAELEEHAIATAYYVRSVQLDPWAKVGTEVYQTIAHLLLEQEQEDNAVLAWREGFTRFPRECGFYWENVAVCYHRKGRWEESAYHAACALGAQNSNAEKCRAIINEAKGKLDAAGVKRVEERIARAGEDVEKLQKAADAARAARKKTFFVPEFAKFLKEYEESNGMPPDEGGVGKDEAGGAAEPAPPAEPPADAAAKWIQSKLNMAKSYRKNGMDEKALSVLQEVLDKHPDHPDAKEARRLQEEWKKK